MKGGRKEAGERREGRGEQGRGRMEFVLCSRKKEEKSAPMPGPTWVNIVHRV